MILGFKISIWSMLRFQIFQILLIVLPGLAVIYAFDIKTSWLSGLCLCYAIGSTLNIFEYFIAAIFDSRGSYLIVAMCTVFVSGGVIYKTCAGKKEINIVECNKNIELMGTLFLFGFLFVNVFAYSAYYLGTNVNGVSHISRDMQYWCSNSVALKIQFPADNLFMQGSELFYHYFSSIQIAFFSIISGIDVFTLSFPLYSLAKTFIVVGAAIYISELLCVDIRWFILGVLLLICTTGFEDISVVTYLHHILISPFGFDIGYAYGIYFVACLIVQWRKKRFEKSSWILICLFWAACVGAKAPIALVLLLIPGALCFYWLLKRKWKLGLCYGCSILSIFLVINFFCVGAFSVVQGTGNWWLRLHTLQDVKTFGGGANWNLSCNSAQVFYGKSSALYWYCYFNSMDDSIVLAQKAD